MPLDYLPYPEEGMDRRRKILTSQHKEVRQDYRRLHSYAKTAAKWGVSKRLVIFICRPDSLAAHKANQKVRIADGRYYDKEEHRVAVRSMRAHKRTLGLYRNRSRCAPRATASSPGSY